METRTPDEALDIDWPTQGDRLIADVQALIGSERGVSGWSVYTTGISRSEEAEVANRYRVSAHEGGLRSWLELTHRVDGQWLIAIGAETAEILSVDHGLWTTAIGQSIGDVDGGDEYNWSVVLVGRRDTTATVWWRFTGPLGRFHVHGHGCKYVSFLPGQQRMGSAWLEDLAPLVVSGRTTAYSSEQALEEADRDAADLCAALTLDGAPVWTVLRSAQLGVADPLELPSEQHPGLREHAGPHEHPRPPSNTQMHGDVPAILERQESDPEFAQLLAGFYHARQVESSAPSLALVLYAGIVETVGLRLRPVTRCDCCTTCTAQVGYARAYRAGLRKVLTRRQSAPLERLYSARSATAHTALLHGEESFPALRWTSIFNQDLSWTFPFTAVQPLRDAAAELLRCWVKDQLQPLDKQG